MIEYSSMVKSLVKNGDTIAAEINGNDANLIHLAFGISGEAGELLDAIKKHVIYRKPLDFDNVKEELGDIEFFLEALRQHFGLSRESILKGNMSKLEKRYPQGGYSDKDAQARADKS